MSIEKIETVELGEIRVSDQKATVFTVSHIGTGVAVTLYDMQTHVGGVAHIILPDSTLGGGNAENLPAKFANQGIPDLISAFESAGGNRQNSVVRMVGGAQLFNFGGGGGNILNIGARNATAIRAAISKQGLSIGKADTGGNRGKALRFLLATGQMFVCQVGGTEYLV